MRAIMMLVVASPLALADSVERYELNKGNLILEGIPRIPLEVQHSLFPYQEIRSARFRTWSAGDGGIYVTTGYGSVEALHKVDKPRAARDQQTFFREPVSGVGRRPGSQELTFTRDVGGSEFSQIFRFDPEAGEATMLTDGKSRNGNLRWDQRGERIAYQSTRRNGAANDLWVMRPDEPETAELVVAATDGSYWAPAEFSRAGNQLLARNRISKPDTRACLIDLDSGAVTILAGGGQNKTRNVPIAFDDHNNGFWLVTNQGSEFDRLAWQSLAPGATPEILTGDIPWNIGEVVISDDRRRMAFIANEDGVSRLYLMNPRTREYRVVDSMPIGVAFGLEFSPDGGKLGMTLNMPRAPSDAYALRLGRDPVKYGRLERWTKSETGGIKTREFSAPELVRYPTFDGRQVPAWIHRPAGEGPHPVVIRVHGGPESQARPVFTTIYQMWVARLGAAVIQPNVRGSSGYGKTYASLDDGFRREDAVRDIGALLYWIEAQPDLDAGRVAVYGGSYGGYMALASAVHFSDRLSAVIDNVGISNFVTFLENTQDYRRDQRRPEYGDERDPATRAFLEKVSPLNNVERISVPMLIVQGQNDPRVPVTEAVQMVEALRAEGNTVWYMNALNEGHGYRKRENQDIFQQTIFMFLQRYLIDESRAQ
jgi:dipeptidyl aminopeptidase/acylaminoacyl peptidase